MNPTAPAPTPADHRAVTATARRLGPPIVVGSLAVTVALLAWLAVAPTAIAGPIQDAPFDVAATLVVGPDDDGCLRLVDGGGDEVEHCIAQLAFDRGANEYRWREVGFDAQGNLRVHDETSDRRTTLTVDPATGDVLDADETTDVHAETFVEEPIGHEPPPPEHVVHTSGDQVVRSNTDPARGDGPGEVVLDLDGPPGYQLHGAVLSPDGHWVVTVTQRGQVVVAPTDGSAPPYVWTEADADRWLDLHRAIRWDG